MARRRRRVSRRAEGDRPRRVRRRALIEGLARVLDDDTPWEDVNQGDSIYLRELPNKLGSAVLMADGVILVEIALGPQFGFLVPGENGTKDRVFRLTGSTSCEELAWETEPFTDCICKTDDPEKHQEWCPGKLVCTCSYDEDEQPEHEEGCDFYEPEDGFELDFNEEDDALLDLDEDFDEDGNFIDPSEKTAPVDGSSSESTRRAASKVVAEAVSGTGEPKVKPLFGGKASTSSKVYVVGDAYDVKEDLKRMRFRWDPSEKYWWKRVPDKSIDKLKEKVEDLGDVSIEVVV